MTVKELRDLLGQYPDEAQVFVVQERKPGKYAGKMMDAEVSWVIGGCVVTGQKFRLLHLIFTNSLLSIGCKGLSLGLV